MMLIGRAVVVAALWAVLASVGAAGYETGFVEEELAGKPPYRRLFLDASVTEESAGLQRVFHTAEKYSGNPILRPEKPWEGNGVMARGTVMWQDGKLVMHYKCIGPDSKSPCIATSTDGIHWDRPDMGQIEYAGSKQNNIIRNGTASIIRIRKPQSPDQIWGAYGSGDNNSARVTFFKDITNWDRTGSKSDLFKTSDVSNFFYDPIKDRYVSTYKTGNRRHRAVGIALSKNGYDWSKPVEGPVFGADDLDPDATQVYGMPAFPYQGMYIGLPWMYHARWMKYGVYDDPKKMYEAEKGSDRTIDVQFAWSWDLISWNRTPQRQPFIALGKPGTFDWAMILTVRNPVIVGDKLYIYYYGCDNVHGEQNINCATGLATIRIDGFCSMNAAQKEGWLLSRREVFATPRIAINAKCSKGGYVTAELLDRNNNVIRGFARADCHPFRADSVRGQITWKTGSFPQGWVNKDKKIRFFLRDADLYSYLPADIDTNLDKGLPD